MSSKSARRLVAVVVTSIAISWGLSDRSLVNAATHWLPLLSAGSHGEGQARPAITSATGNPVTFAAACTASNEESATLTWTTAGSAVTGYAVYVSSTVNGTFALDATQPTGTALTVTETYTSGSTGKKFYRLEAKSTNWAFPGATMTNARQAAVSGTNGGYLTMSSTPSCTATA